MRRLLTVVALGLGLLTAGTAIDPAGAAPYRAAPPAEFAQAITPVQYQRDGYYRRRYAPPPRQWRRYETPRRPVRGWRHPGPGRYRSRY